MLDQIQPFSIAEILNWIPHQRPFRFIDGLNSVTGESCEGWYTYREDETFYSGHFPDFPITPGVILLETMCQIGLVPMGMYLISQELSRLELAKFKMFFCESQLELLHPVLPGTRITVNSKKIYWRFKKLKCETEMRNESGQVVARSISAGVGGLFDI